MTHERDGTTRRRGATSKRSRAARSPARGARLEALANLGPVSARALARAGIVDEAGLRRLGSVAAWRATRAVWPGASLNLLWALEGALTGRPWQVVAREDRLRLLLELEAAADADPDQRAD